MFQPQVHLSCICTSFFYRQYFQVHLYNSHTATRSSSFTIGKLVRYILFQSLFNCYSNIFNIYMFYSKSFVNVYFRSIFQVCFSQFSYTFASFSLTFCPRFWCFFFISFCIFPFFSIVNIFNISLAFQSIFIYYKLIVISFYIV